MIMVMMMMIKIMGGRINVRGLFFKAIVMVVMMMIMVMMMMMMMKIMGGRMNVCGLLSCCKY